MRRRAPSRGRPGRRKNRSYKKKRKIKTAAGRSPGRIGFRLS